MRRGRGWVIAAVISIGIAVAVYVFQPHEDSPEHSSTSDAANGTSAVVLFAQAMGHPTVEVADTFAPPAADALLIVFTPTSPFTSDEAARTADWVRSGGHLIYASEQGDPELDRALDVSRLSRLASSSTAIANPVLAGVGQVAGGSFAVPFFPSPGQVPILRSRSGFALGYIESFGSGSVVLLADPLVLCNGYLDKLDNGRLLADLLGTVGPGALVAVDEYHHGLTLNDLSPQAWVLTPWGAALLWLLVAVFAGLILRGRRFGPLIPRPAEVARADVEWAVAVGELLRRSGARAMTLGLLATASERAVAARTGLPLHPRERFWNALWIRAPELAAELAEAEHALYGSESGDTELLKAARRLHQVAYPVSSGRRPLLPSASKEVR
ncbi:MAG TPA: DUF4350 domain-containing protein [Candidatus Limnocylindria bacterium]|nr:DUF4350 domain-containing protein [Candidatus Limnocylindria bacterium]